MQKPLTQPEKNSHKRSMTLAFGFNQITPDTFYGSYAFPSRRLGAVDMSVEAQKQTEDCVHSNNVVSESGSLVQWLA